MKTQDAIRLAAAINDGQLDDYHGRAYEVPTAEDGQSVVTAYQVTNRTMRSVVLWSDPRKEEV